MNVIEISGGEQSLFDSLFLEKIAAMEEDNLTIKLLEKLLNDEIKVYIRKNIVKS